MPSTILGEERVDTIVGSWKSLLTLILFLVPVRTYPVPSHRRDTNMTCGGDVDTSTTTYFLLI